MSSSGSLPSRKWSPEPKSEEEQEAEADRFYSSRQWIINQAELVTSLLDQGHPVLAHKAIQGVIKHLDMWDIEAKWDLRDTYMITRQETRRKYKDVRRN